MWGNQRTKECANSAQNNSGGLTETFLRAVEYLGRRLGQRHCGRALRTSALCNQVRGESKRRLRERIEQVKWSVERRRANV